MIEVIIISNAKTDELMGITQDAILSCKTTCDAQITIVEQTDFKFNGTKTIKIDEDFNYNRFANIAIRQSDAEWFVVCNNDLLFCHNWLKELVLHNEVYGDLILSSKCPKLKKQKHIITPSYGYCNKTSFSSWCFMIHKSVWQEIGSFNEDFPFWCADNVVLEQFKKINERPVLVPMSLVVHSGSETLKTMENIDELTISQVKKFNKLYNRNILRLGC